MSFAWVPLTTSVMGIFSGEVEIGPAGAAVPECVIFISACSTAWWMSCPRVSTMTFAGPLVVRKEVAGFLKPGFRANLQRTQATKVQGDGALCQARSLAAAPIIVPLRKKRAGLISTALTAAVLRIFAAACEKSREATRDEVKCA